MGEYQEHKLNQLTRLTIRERDKGRGKKVYYSNEVKILVHELHESGFSYKVLREAAGVGDKTIRRWLSVEKSNFTNHKFRSLKVNSGESKFDLILPGGAKITGLSFDQVKQMVTNATAA